MRTPKRCGGPDPCLGTAYKFPLESLTMLDVESSCNSCCFHSSTLEYPSAAAAACKSLGEAFFRPPAGGVSPCPSSPCPVLGEIVGVENPVSLPVPGLGTLGVGGKLGGQPGGLGQA